jgi:lipopolysaccharide export system protein LptC
MAEATHTPQLAGEDEARYRRLHRPGQGYTRFVTVMKIALPMLAAGLVVLLAVWSQFNLQETRFSLGITEVAPEQIESLNMVNARFDGIDEKNRPYSVTAELVTQDGEDADTIELTAPKADITLESGAWIALTANSGAFSRKDEILDLAGDVSLFHDRGFEMHTESAQVNLAEGVASGETPVFGQGPAGELEAEGFRISDDGQRILFGGHARLLILPEGVDPDDLDTPPSAAIPAAGGVGQ